MYKVKYSVNGKSLFVRIAAVLMLLSVMFRLIGYWGFWKNQSACFGYMQILLPILCNIAFAVLIVYFGEEHFALTLIPVVLGAVFFIVKATDMNVIPMLVCMVMTALTVVVYIATVLGGIESKWILAGVFGVPLLYQLIIRDGATIVAAENAMPMDKFIPELSLLCILTALLLVVFAMKKVVPGEPEIFEGEIVDGDSPVEEIVGTEEPALLENKCETSQEDEKE